MAKAKKKSAPSKTTAATVGYEAELWQMADALRGSMDAAEYKHVALGLIFLKYISDAFRRSNPCSPSAPRAMIVPRKSWIKPCGGSSQRP